MTGVGEQDAGAHATHVRVRYADRAICPAGAALKRAALDAAWRVEKLLGLYDAADAVLVRALAEPLTRADLGGAAVPAILEDDNAPA